MTRLLPALLVVLTGAAWAQDYGTTHRLKIPVGGATRKGGLFLPKSATKNDFLPLVVAVPDTKGKAYLEIGQWQQPAYERRFAVLSVDVVTSGERGWAPSDQLEMQRDIEAVTTGIELAFQRAEEASFRIDPSAIVITGHSGGTYLTLWLGIRRPDLFLAVCGRACVFHKETVERGKLDKVEPNLDQPIFLFRGELDHPRVSKETELAAKMLQDAGYRKVTYRVIQRMVHESKPEVFLAWLSNLLQDTAKGRREARKVAEELVKIRELVDNGKAGAYSKLAKLVEREKKAGFAAGAVDLMDKVLAESAKAFRQAEDMEANGNLEEAVAAFRKVEKKYSPLAISKEARKRAGSLKNSDAYKAAEMLAKAKAYLEKDQREKAADILQKIVDRYPETPAGEEADLLLRS